MREVNLTHKLGYIFSNRVITRSWVNNHVLTTLTDTLSLRASTAYLLFTATSLITKKLLFLLWFFFFLPLLHWNAFLRLIILKLGYLLWLNLKVKVNGFGYPR